MYARDPLPPDFRWAKMPHVVCPLMAVGKLTNSKKSLLNGMTPLVAASNGSSQNLVRHPEPRGYGSACLKVRRTGKTPGPQNAHDKPGAKDFAKTNNALTEKPRQTRDPASQEAHLES